LYEVANKLEKKEAHKKFITAFTKNAPIGGKDRISKNSLDPTAIFSLPKENIHKRSLIF